MASEYNLKWRNITVNWVNWERKILRFQYDSGASMTVMFKDIDSKIEHSSDVQAIKMIMDRYMVKSFFRFNYPNDDMRKYIKNIFQHPYEEGPLLEE